MWFLALTTAGKQIGQKPIKFFLKNFKDFNIS